MKNIDLLNTDHKDIIARIKSRQKTLRFASRELKKHFVGIDHVIDKIIKSIEPWAAMPELLTRPIVITLFGPTGVGKTDLVRRLVKLLNFHDRFCEIEMMNKGNSSMYPWHSSISSILASNPRIESGKPCILLLDEIQNFRTVNEEGDELPEYKYRDIWTLLSDGKLPFQLDLDYLLQVLWDLGEKEKREASIPKPDQVKIPLKMKRMMRQDDDLDFSDLDDNRCVDGLMDEVEDQVADVPEAESADDDDWSNGYHTLKHLKAVLRLTESIEEIAKWSTAKKKSVIIQKINEQSSYEEVDYTKSLIFISGNLDEAYEFAKKTNEVDVDADIFHKLSSKINILDIKKALTSRFKPEQIARFGNTQIIYPTLSKTSYETIIQRKVRDIVKNVKERCNVDIEVDSSIHRLIYENGVFPTQGTRPVFSTISEILESPLPPFLLNAFSNKIKHLKVSYENGNILAEINHSTLKYPYRGVLDKLRTERNKNIDRRALGAVHEAGHAVVYAELFRASPPQTSSFPASTEIGGFVWVHEICGSKEMIENKICAILAGRMAEVVVFGNQNTTWGGQDDLHEATKLAGAMAKRYAMDKFSSFIMHPQRSDVVNTDVSMANPVIESIVSRFSSRAEEIIKSRKNLFNEVVDFLLEHKELLPADFKKICAKHGIKIGIQKSEDILYSDYNQQYQDFKKKT